MFVIDFDSQDDNIEVDMEGFIEDLVIVCVVEEVICLEQQFEKQLVIQVFKVILDEEILVVEIFIQEVFVVVNEQFGEVLFNIFFNEEVEVSILFVVFVFNLFVVDFFLDLIIWEDEFEDDFEVMFCCLFEEDSKVKF